MKPLLHLASWCSQLVLLAAHYCGCLKKGACLPNLASQPFQQWRFLAVWGPPCTYVLRSGARRVSSEFETCMRCTTDCTTACSPGRQACSDQRAYKGQSPSSCLDNRPLTTDLHTSSLAALGVARQTSSVETQASGAIERWAEGRLSQLASLRTPCSSM